MELPLMGGCLCGKVRYEITEAPREVYACHCLDCQRLTSSAFSMAMNVPDAAFHLTGASPRALESIADSGRIKVRLVCPECGCWICGNPDPQTGLRRVRCGSLDDTS